MTNLVGELMRPDAVGPADRAAWADWRAETPGADSPFMTWGFAAAVAQVRPDAYVGVVRRGARVVGFWPLHVRPGGLARPIGAPFADRHGPVFAPDGDLRASEALAALGLAGYAFTASPVLSVDADLCPFEASADCLVDLSDGLGAWRKARADRLRALDRRMRRLTELNPVSIRLDAADGATLGVLLALKRRQFRRTGAHDVLASPWARELMHRLLTPDPAWGLSPMLATLTIGDRLAAAEFNLQAGHSLASWIVAMEPAFRAAAPGLQLMRAVIEHAPERGITQIGLGDPAPYKFDFANAQTPLTAGFLAAHSALGAPWAARAQRWRRLEGRLGLMARVRRRADQIASASLTPQARLHGAATALAAPIGGLRSELDRRMALLAAPAARHSVLVDQAAAWTGLGSGQIF